MSSCAIRRDPRQECLLCPEAKWGFVFWVMLKRARRVENLIVAIGRGKDEELVHKVGGCAGKKMTLIICSTRPLVILFIRLSS